MKKKQKLKTDWDKLRKMKDSDIDYSDIPETDSSFWEKAQVMCPIALDADVFSWFKKHPRTAPKIINHLVRDHFMPS